MGCGQSKIGIYQRKPKSKKNGSKRSAEGGENDEEAEEAEETIKPETKDCGEGEKKEEDLDAVASKIKQMAQQQQIGGAVLAQRDRSSSQLDFFKMLDEKIENGPDYEESDEEEQLARMESLLQEWRAACLARQQKWNDEHENWRSPARIARSYQDEYENYPKRRKNPVDTQRFPTGYSQCPPNSTITVHVQNSFRVQPRTPMMANYHFQAPAESYNHCEDTGEPSNSLRGNYPQVMLRQSSITQMHYPENQRLYSENIRQLSEFSRAYQEQRAYQSPRPMPPHEHRLYSQDVNSRGYPPYQEDSRQPEEVQRMMADVRSYHDSQRPSFMNVDNQRGYHERLKEKQRQFADGRQMEGPKAPRPPLRPTQDQQRIYRDLESEDHCFPRQERFPEPSHNASRSLNMEVQYVGGPPPPREMIPLQGVPGPPREMISLQGGPGPSREMVPPQGGGGGPQGSPRPLLARGLQTHMHRLPAGSVVHYRKPQGAFT